MATTSLPEPYFSKRHMEDKKIIHDICDVELTLGGWDLDNLVIFETNKQWNTTANKYNIKHKINFNIESEDIIDIKPILLEMNGRETTLIIKEDNKITTENVYMLSYNIFETFNIVRLYLTIPSSADHSHRKYVYASGHNHLCQECHKQLYFSEVVDSNKSIISVEKLKELWKMKQVEFYCCNCYNSIVLKGKITIPEFRMNGIVYPHDSIFSSSQHTLGLCEPDPNHHYFVSVGEWEYSAEPEEIDESTNNNEGTDFVIGHALDDSYEDNEPIPISISFNSELDNNNYVSIDPPEQVENMHTLVESEDYQEIVRRISEDLFIGFETRESRRERKIRESRREIREISLDDLEAELMDEGETE